MAKTTLVPTATSRDVTYALNSSNHPEIGSDGLVVGPTPTLLPNATPSLLDYLRSLPGVTVVEPATAK